MQTTTGSPAAAAALGYAGLLPFVAGALAVWPAGADAAAVVAAFLGYGVAILAFLGGIQWGAALQPSAARASERLAVGVLPPLIGWVALALPPAPASAVLGLAFAALLGWERTRGRLPAPAWYPALRLRLTLIVILCHGVVLAALLTGG